MTANDTFLGINRDLDEEDVDDEHILLSYSPGAGELAAVRAVLAVLVALSAGVNALFVAACVRCALRAKRRGGVGGTGFIYWSAAAMIFPDLALHARVCLEAAAWGDSRPDWASSRGACAFWQFCAHWSPMAHAALLSVIVYHAFVSLYLDHDGFHERAFRRLASLALAAVLVPTLFFASPSAINSRVRLSTSAEDLRFQVP